MDCLSIYFMAKTLNLHGILFLIKFLEFPNCWMPKEQKIVRCGFSCSFFWRMYFASLKYKFYFMINVLFNLRKPGNLYNLEWIKDIYFLTRRTRKKNLAL